MKAILIPILTLAVCFSACKKHEHPQEHPSDDAKTEHPAGEEHDHSKHEHPEGESKEHPKTESTKTESKTESKTDENKEHPEHPKGSMFNLKKDYDQAVSGHIGERTANEGAFAVVDEKLQRKWDLSLVKIHSDKIVHLGNDRYFACADFKEGATGKIIDLDFYATYKNGSWEIDPALIHKVEGKPRYTYNSKNERVPAKGR